MSDTVLRALCEHETGLSPEDVGRLEQVAAALPVIAELVQADVFIDCMDWDGVALVVAFVCHVLNKTGKDEQSMVVSLLGTVLILILLAQKIGVLISTLREIFGI